MNSPLKMFEEEEHHDIQGLKAIAESHDQMKFLEALSNCQSFIEWLQQETNGNVCLLCFYLCFDLFIF